MTATFTFQGSHMIFDGITGRPAGVRPSIATYRGFGFDGEGVTIAGSSAPPSQLNCYAKFQNAADAESLAADMERNLGQFGTLGHSNGITYSILLLNFSGNIKPTKQGLYIYRLEARVTVQVQPTSVDVIEQIIEEAE